LERPVRAIQQYASHAPCHWGRCCCRRLALWGPPHRAMAAKLSPDRRDMSGGRQGRAPWALVGTARRSCERLSHDDNTGAGRPGQPRPPGPVAARPCAAGDVVARPGRNALARSRRCCCREGTATVPPSSSRHGQQQAPSIGESKSAMIPVAANQTPANLIPRGQALPPTGADQVVALPRSEAKQRPTQRWLRWPWRCRRCLQAPLSDRAASTARRTGSCPMADG
jgi:hypothetical protein